jgi:hypothetical protein
VRLYYITHVGQTRPILVLIAKLARTCNGGRYLGENAALDMFPYVLQVRLVVALGATVLHFKHMLKSSDVPESFTK